MLRRLIIAVLVGILAVGGVATPALASGSADLFPRTGSPEPACSASTRCRAAIEWRTNAYGPTAAGETRIQRRTLFSVFVQEGERILTGSSSPSVGNGTATSPGTGAAAGGADIVIWNPGQITDTEAAVLPPVVDGGNGFLCSMHRSTPTAGVISTRALEVARARAVDNPGGYEPCVYVAPETGLYRVAFYGSAGPAGSADGSPDYALDPGTFRANAGTSVNAWDVTVRAAGDDSTSGNRLGRLFTYVLAGFTGGNPRPVTMSMYLNTLDGYRYLVDTHGFDPNGFVFYGNRQGFLDADGKTPLNHDVVGQGAAPQQLPSLAGGVHLAPPEYPLSFEPLAPETLAALEIPLDPVPPVLSAVDFAGRATARGEHEGQGGTFTLDAETGGTYEIVISRDGISNDPGLPANRALRGVIPPGKAEVVWDGLDNTGTAFPVKEDYQVRSVLRGGEYHAPMLDVESSTLGGPSITLLNPPVIDPAKGALCPFTGATSNCNRVFFDDRAYTSSSRQFVGDASSGLLCSTFLGALPAAPYFADPATGVDSTSTARAFGDGHGANANSQCAANGTLGDAKGLDVWTYFPSVQFSTALDVLPKPDPPKAVEDSGTTTVNTTLVVAAADGILRNDEGTRISVLTAVTTGPLHGTVTLGTDGSYTYVPTTDWIGTDSFVYTITDDAGQQASAQVNLTVTPRAVDDTWTIPVNTTLVASPGVLANDAGAPLDAAVVAPPTHGELTLRADGTFDYVPARDFSGTDTFTYEARRNGMSASAEVTIVVTPTATDDDAGTIPPNVTHTVAGPGVLTNDSGTGLTIVSVGPPAHGTVVMEPDGGYRYTPPPGWGGTDTFTYLGKDFSDQPVSAVVTVHVTPPVQLAAANDDSATGLLNRPVTLSELVNDVPGDNLAFDLGSVRLTDPVSGLPVLSVTVAGEGTWEVVGGGIRFTPVSFYVGQAHLGYSVTNTAGQTVSARLTVTYSAPTFSTNPTVVLPPLAAVVPPAVVPPAAIAPPAAAVPPAAAPAVINVSTVVPVATGPTLAHTGFDPSDGASLALVVLLQGLALVLVRRRWGARA